MRPEERDPAYLWDMLEAARAMLRFTADLSLAEFLAGETDAVRSAVERKLEIMGEAARRVSPNLRAEHPEVPWKEMVGACGMSSDATDISVARVILSPPDGGRRISQSV